MARKSAKKGKEEDKKEDEDVTMAPESDITKLTKKEIEAKEEKKRKEDEKEKKKKEQKPLTPLEEIQLSVNTLTTGVTTKDRLLLARSLRNISAVRSKLTSELVCTIVNDYYPSLEPTGAAHFLALYKAPPAAMEDEGEKKKDEEEEEKLSEEELAEAKAEAEKKAKEAEKRKEEARKVPEVWVYVHQLVLFLLLDNKQHAEAEKCVDALFALVQSYNRRTLDLLSSHVYSLYSFAHESTQTLSSVRNSLLFAYRSACLQHNEPGQASLTCCILRNYLNDKLYTQADKFRLNSSFPESAHRSNNFYSRYLYYVGVINSVQLHYSEAYGNLAQALRKAPAAAAGFRLKALQLRCIVQMLMGEIPERADFLEPALKASLRPYFLLTQTVRVGDPTSFESTLQAHKDQFIQDGVYSLIVRLRNNVIKTGLRKINLSYSRISIQDVCTKLNLPSVEDTEHVVAKAIHDGVIDAVIDRKQHYLFSRENHDVYTTNEPQDVFHKRIQFCMDIHNGAVKALRYPANAHKSQADLDAEKELRAEEEELAAAIKEAEEED
jgi:26S proteasome regulatory subunit N3